MAPFIQAIIETDYFEQATNIQQTTPIKSRIILFFLKQSTKSVRYFLPILAYLKPLFSAYAKAKIRAGALILSASVGCPHGAEPIAISLGAGEK
ncbi:MAG: hypothetical protein H6559_01040 [Lewinellaceae bacterium]|nr:hypothetical protein [Lewinellaceae bacterium]